MIDHCRLLLRTDSDDAFSLPGDKHSGYHCMFLLITGSDTYTTVGFRITGSDEPARIAISIVVLACLDPFSCRTKFSP